MCTLLLKSMLIADLSVENMNPGATPNGMLLDISLLLKKKWKKIQQTSNFYKDCKELFVDKKKH